MNKFKKIALSALAGSLVAMSAQAEISMSADASVALTKNNEGGKTSYYQSDSIYFTYAGETDGGLNVTVKVEVDDQLAHRKGYQEIFKQLYCIFVDHRRNRIGDAVYFSKEDLLEEIVDNESNDCNNDNNWNKWSIKSSKPHYLQYIK